MAISTYMEMKVITNNYNYNNLLYLSLLAGCKIFSCGVSGSL